MSTTHEAFIQAVRDITIEDALSRHAITPDEAEKLRHVKLVYGVGGRAGVRGTTFYEAWANGQGVVDAVEICALGEESWVQLAGTTIHELGHVLAGHGAGHGKEWKTASHGLGFTKLPAAAGQFYWLSLIRPSIRHKVYELAKSMSDGSPAFFTSGLLGLLQPTAPRPCSAGRGTRGGKSRGKGSGSRLRLWECQCSPKPVKVRVASDDFQATCDVCGSKFERKP